MADDADERTAEVDVTRSLCIVGAGMAGVGAAYALCHADVDVTILEKNRGVGGRAATRRKYGCRYDHGANYVKDDDGRVANLVESLGTDGLVDVEEPVWTFDAAGDVSPGRDADDHKWTWSAGIAQFPKRLLERTDATVRTETRVEALERLEDGWQLVDGEGTRRGPFDGILLTPPAPQTASLLADTRWDDEHILALREAIGAVPYRTIRTVVLAYDFTLDVPWYALVNVDKEHAVGWLSREECKPGHVPDGEGLLVVQMSPEWSSEHDGSLAEATADVASRVAALVGDDRLRDPRWSDDQQWRYALPDGNVPDELLDPSDDEGLFFAGDWVVGEGRVHTALRCGLEAGERIDRAL